MRKRWMSRRGRTLLQRGSQRFLIHLDVDEVGVDVDVDEVGVDVDVDAVEEEEGSEAGGRGLEAKERVRMMKTYLLEIQT
jgi:hypothetical protein